MEEKLISFVSENTKPRKKDFIQREWIKSILLLAPFISEPLLHGFSVSYFIILSGVVLLLLISLLVFYNFKIPDKLNFDFHNQQVIYQYEIVKKSENQLVIPFENFSYKNQILHSYMFPDKEVIDLFFDEKRFLRLQLGENQTFTEENFNKLLQLLEENF